jgi:MarR family transcriptional regulator, organic hydroperoxide resistance regulator
MVSQPASKPIADGQEVWRLLRELMRDARSRFMAAVAEVDLSPAQANALLQLEQRDPLPMHALADGLLCDASNVTGIVDRLEARGLVERRPLASDRRVKTVALTDAGAALRERMIARLRQPPAGIAALSASQQRRLAALLALALDVEQRRGRDA